MESNMRNTESNRRVQLKVSQKESILIGEPSHVIRLTQKSRNGPHYAV